MKSVTANDTGDLLVQLIPDHRPPRNQGEFASALNQGVLAADELHGLPVGAANSLAASGMWNDLPRSWARFRPAPSTSRGTSAGGTYPHFRVDANEQVRNLQIFNAPADSGEHLRTADWRAVADDDEHYVYAIAL